ncbi:MAG: NAD-dependent epimerase/dehydratase family protein, partial [Deltaproteobacteria bacterium]
AVGKAAVAALVDQGKSVRVAQRRKPNNLPANVDFQSCDLLDLAQVKAAVHGASHVLLAVGFAYDSRVWEKVWPTTMRNIVEACAQANARVVFIDNLYQLGPQSGPRHEGMTLSRKGNKARVLTEVADIWMAARDRVKFASLRCSDFYGPNVPVSHLGSEALGGLAQGKTAQLVVPPDTLHDFAYVPDIVRAALILLDATDDAYGQVWNMPCAPSRTPRELLVMGAASLGVQPKIFAMPFALVPFVGLFVRFMKEVADVSYTWDRPYIVDGSKFAKHFGFKVTPFEVGIPVAAASFRETKPTALLQAAGGKKQLKIG